MQTIRKKDIAKISYKPWSYQYDIDISLIEKIELGKTKTKLIFKKGKERLFKTTALLILASNSMEIINA
jgi:hypothetical protein